MKKVLLLFLFFCSTTAYSQHTDMDENPEEKRARPWRFLASPGVSFDLSGTSSDPNSSLLGERPSAVPLVELQLMYPISRRVEGYLRLQLNFYKDKRPEYLGLDLAEDFFHKVFWPVSTFHPSFDTGIRYRIGWNNWSVHPGIGIGYAFYLYRRSGTDADGLSYKQRGEAIFANAGIDVRYTLKEGRFLSFGADYQQPLQKSYGRLTGMENETETVLTYRTSRMGKSLNLRVGYGISF